MTSQQKIDDEDGHYIVTPDTDLGDRCESSVGILPQSFGLACLVSTQSDVL